MKKILTIISAIILVAVLSPLSVVAQSLPCYPGKPCIETYTPLVVRNFTSARSDVFGFVVDENGIPMDRGVIRLAQIYCNDIGECVFVLDVAHSPVGWVNPEDGSFYIPKVYPRNYVIAYGWGDVSHNYQIICEPGTSTPKVWELLPDQDLDVGILSVWRREGGKADVRLVIKDE